jgi:hypothetical protein
VCCCSFRRLAKRRIEDASTQDRGLPMTKTSKRRGRPPGYPARKWAVLRMVADEAVVAPPDSFVLTQSVRRGLQANRCSLHESTVSDHCRSYRTHKAALVEEARRRRYQPQHAQVPVVDRSWNSLQTMHFDYRSAMPISALIKTLDPWKEMSSVLSFAARHQDEMKKFTDALLPAAGLLRDFNKPQSEFRRLLDSIQAVGQPFRLRF